MTSNDTGVVLPEPAWIAIDTPGADFDVTFVRSMSDAMDFDDDDHMSQKTKLYTSDQLTAAVLAERERWRADAERLGQMEGGRAEYVLLLLITAGHVTQAKVDEARKIAFGVEPIRNPQAEGE